MASSLVAMASNLLFFRGAEVVTHSDVLLKWSPDCQTDPSACLKASNMVNHWADEGIDFPRGRLYVCLRFASFL